MTSTSSVCVREQETEKSNRKDFGLSSKWANSSKLPSPLSHFFHSFSYPPNQKTTCMCIHTHTHIHTQKLIKHRTNMWPEDSQKQPWLITLSYPSSLHPNLFISVTHAYNAPTPLHPHAHLIAFAHRQLFWHTGNSCLQRYDSQTGCDSTEYECLRDFSLCVMYN